MIRSEIKPFRGPLLGFFFISVGLSLYLGALIRFWPAVIGVAVLLLVVTFMTTLGEPRSRWSCRDRPSRLPPRPRLRVAFVILSMPAVRALVGETTSAALIAAVAFSSARPLPALAESGPLAADACAGARLAQPVRPSQRAHRPRVHRWNGPDSAHTR